QLAPSNSVAPAGTRVPLTAPSACWKTSRTRSGCACSITGSAVIALRRRFSRLLRAERRDPARAPLVVAEQEVGGAHGLDDLGRAGVHDRARQAVARGGREERGAQPLSAP